MDDHGHVVHSWSPVGKGLHLDGSDGTYVKIKRHDKDCMENPSRCDITIGFFFKFRLASDPGMQIFFGNKDNDDDLYKGVNIFYKSGKIHVFVYGKYKYCTKAIYAPLGVWFYLGLIWEQSGTLAVYVDGWLGYANLGTNCGSSPGGLKTRDDYYLGRDTFPIAYYKDLNIWYSKQEKSVLDEKWEEAFGK